MALLRHRKIELIEERENIDKTMGQSSLKLFEKEMQHIIFNAHVHICCPSYADEE